MEITVALIVTAVTLVLGQITKVTPIPNKYIPLQNIVIAVVASIICIAFNVEGMNALDTVLTPMGYTREEMIAFGDGHNDSSIIKFAGTGVAMANAVQALKDIADEITLSNEEDGIAESLYKHIPEIN